VSLPTELFNDVDGAFKNSFAFWFTPNSCKYFPNLLL